MLCIPGAHGDAAWTFGRVLTFGGYRSTQTMACTAQFSVYRVLHAHLRSCCVVCSHCFDLWLARQPSARLAVVLPAQELLWRHFYPPRADASNAGRDLQLVKWRRRCCVLARCPASAAALFSCVFLIASSCHGSIIPTAPTLIVFLLCAGGSWAACARLSAPSLHSRALSLLAEAGNRVIPSNTLSRQLASRL